MRKTTAFLLAFATALMVSVATSVVTPLVAPRAFLPTFNPNWLAADLSTIASSELLIGAGSSTISATGPVYDTWKTFTPTGSFVTNATYQGVASRLGGIGRFLVTVTFAGATDATNFTLNTSSLPYTIDQSVVAAAASGGTAAISLMCSGRFSDTGTSIRDTLIVEYAPGGTTIGFRIETTAANTFTAVSNTVPFTYGSTDYFSFYFEAPIQ